MERLGSAEEHRGGTESVREVLREGMVQVLILDDRRCTWVYAHKYGSQVLDSPLFPITNVSNWFSAKLSAWYIIRGLLPTSPRTRIATERMEGVLRGF